MVESRSRTAPLLVVMCLGHVLLISAQVQTRGGESLVESGAFGVFAGVQGVMAAVSGSVRSVWTGYFALRGAARENEELRRRLVELQADYQIERARAQRTQVLEDTLSLKRTLVPPKVAANVIAGSPAGGLDITIDKGSDDGVARDMAVIAVNGVVGRVVDTTRGSARVQLLISGNAAASALLESSGAGGIVQGRDQELLEMNYVSNLVPVEPGETVLTSGQEGIYMQGLVIGRVEQTEEGTEQRTIAVRPAVDFSHIDVVLVILRTPDPPAGTR
jgi:rod shape-determining protein MreC